MALAMADWAMAAAFWTRLRPWTCSVFAWLGYGIRYDYGMFTQAIGKDGEQIERPTLGFAIANGEIRVREDRVDQRFGGYMKSAINEKGSPNRAGKAGDRSGCGVRYADPRLPAARTVNHA